MKNKKRVVSEQKAWNLVGCSKVRFQRLKQGILETVHSNGRQYRLGWTGVRYEVELLSKTY